MTVFGFGAALPLALAGLASRAAFVKWRGTLLSGGKTAKAGHIYVLQGKQQEEVPEAIAGDIVAIAKFDDLHVSDTVSNVGGNTTVRNDVRLIAATHSEPANAA